MSKKFEVNLVVIGGGSAGLVSSYIAAAVKAKVVLIERHKMGGDCLNTGCVPSKAILRSAKMASYMKRSEEFGFKAVKPVPVFKNIMQRVHKVIETIEPHDSIERYTGLGVECVTGEATILSPHEVQVGDRVITTKNIIIASGARPFVPPIEGLDKIDYLTSDNIWNITEQPKRLIVLGGGPIGCELSQAFGKLGSDVTQVEMMPTIMGREDDDAKEVVAASMKNSNVNVLTEHRALRVETENNNKVLICDNNGEEVRIEFDDILVAVGRTANTSDLGLDKLGIKLRKNGTIETDDYLRTSVDNIYACGDVTGPYQFTHTAAHQAYYAVVNSLFGFLKKTKVDYRVIPWATFTMPEVARVGLNETDAKAQNVPYDVTKYELDDLDRAIADGEIQGFVKVLTKPGKDKILGVTIVGHHAGDLISEYVLAMRNNLGLKDIMNTIHLYPSLAEANKYAAGMWRQANKPEGVLRWVEKLHNWRRK